MEQLVTVDRDQLSLKLGGADNHPKSKAEKWHSQKVFRATI